MATDLDKLMSEITNQGVMDSLSGVVEADTSRGDDDDARSADVDPLEIGMFTHAHEIGGHVDGHPELDDAIARAANERPIDSPHALVEGRTAKGLIEAGQAADLIGGAFDELLTSGEFNLDAQRGQGESFER